MKNSFSSLIAFLWFSHFLLGSQAIPFSGKISVDGLNFTGEAEFTFSIVTQEGETLWVHDEANEPLNITVENGRYLALLGAQGTTPIPSDLFASEENLSLRVAVDLRDGVGLRVLSPDQEISAVPIALSSLYSAHAGEAQIATSVQPGAITAEMLSEEVLSEFEEINATIADLLSQDYTPEVGSISTSLLSEELQSKILNFELSIEEILDQSNDPAAGSITREMLADSLSSDLAVLTTSVEQITGTGSTIQDGLITTAMLSSDLQDSLGLSAEETNDQDSPRELFHGWTKYEYAAIGTIASNGNGGFVILDDDEGDGLNLRNFDSNGTLISNSYLFVQDDDWSFETTSYDVTRTEDNGFLLVGNTDAGQIEDKSQASFGYKDFWVVKVDAQGGVDWEKSFGGSDDEVSPYTAQFSNGNFLVAGKSYSDAGGSKSEANFGGADVWAVCINQDGEKVWDKAFGGDGNESVAAVVTLADGNVLIAGTTNSTSGGNISSYSFGGTKAIIVIKIDADGNKIWDMTIGESAGDTVLTSAIASPDGGFVIAANTATLSMGGSYRISESSSDIVLYKFNGSGTPNSGSPAWNRRINDADNTVSPNPYLSADGDSFHLVYYVSTQDESTNYYLNIGFDDTTDEVGSGAPNIIKEKQIYVDWEDFDYASSPGLVPVEDGFIFYDRFYYEWAHFNENLDSLAVYADEIKYFGEAAHYKMSEGSAIMFDDLGVFADSSPVRYQDFYNHDDYLYLADPENDPVWSNPDDPEETLETEEGRTVERYLAGWAYDGYGADPYMDDSWTAEAPMVDRAFLVPKVTLKGIGPLVLNHTLLDASARGTAISEEEEYSFTKKYYDWMMDEDVPALWESSSLKSSILNVSEEVAFTHILDDANHTVGLQLIKALDSGTSITEGMVLSSDEIDSASEVASFSGFPDGATIQVSLDYAIFMGWVSDGGYWIGTRLLMSEIEGSLEEGYVAGGEIYKPVP